MRDFAPNKSALYVIKAINLSCSNKGTCFTCSYYSFCSALRQAYREAKKILPKEIIESTDMREADND